MQKIDYTYNIKGWLKKINEPDLSGGEGDFFGAELLYNEGFSVLNGTAMYNGNISGMKWKNGGSGSTQKGYGFIYNQINRLTTSKYGEGTSYTTNVSRYDENLTYDKNGNIRKLYRNGQISTGVFGNIDSLGYKYPGTSNQVWAIGDIVTDVAGRGDFYDATNGYTNKEYYYDKNGNMWLDRNKRMKTVYNYLNLPSRVSDTITPANKIEYVYTSAGEKLKQRLSTGTTLLHFGNYVYTLDGTANGIAVKYILTQEGRATNSAGTYTYEYFMKDHLGNTRVSFNVPSTTAVIVQQNDYYPFGMMHQPRATTTSDNRYLFNNKELQNTLLGGINLEIYDYSSRYYDPQIGRFTTIDLMTESTDEITPYHYCLNNPVINIDPTGMWSETAMGYTTYNQYEIAEFMRSMISQFSTTTTDQERKEKKKEEEKDKKRQEQKQKEEKEKLIEEEKHKLPELSEEDEEFLKEAIIGGAGGIMRVGKTVVGAVKTYKTISQLNTLVLKGKLPKTIKRFERGKFFGELEHVHFSDGSALYKNGKWKHGGKILTNKEIQILKENGWKLPK